MSSDDPTLEDLEDARFLFAFARRFWPSADALTCMAVEVAADLAGQHYAKIAAECGWQRKELFDLVLDADA